MFLDSVKLRFIDTNQIVPIELLEHFTDIVLPADYSNNLPKLVHWSCDDFMKKIQLACHLGNVYAFKLLVFKFSDLDDDELITSAWLRFYFENNRPDYFYVFELAYYKAMQIQDSVLSEDNYTEFLRSLSEEVRG